MLYGVYDPGAVQRPSIFAYTTVVRPRRGEYCLWQRRTAFYSRESRVWVVDTPGQHPSRRSIVKYETQEAQDVKMMDGGMEVVIRRVMGVRRGGLL